MTLRAKFVSLIEVGHEPAPEILATGTIWGE